METPAIAQSNWKLSGNHIALGDFIGTTNHQPMIFKTNGTERMLLHKDGGLLLHGLFEADSATIHGKVIISDGGSSFVFVPNVSIPTLHDLMRVTTSVFTVMGGNKIFSLPLTGMGINTESPNNMLDVNGGDIDVNTATFGYMIGDNYVLRHKGNINNIFVGVGSGAANTGTRNTFVGFNSGNGNITNSDNVYVGFQAGNSTGDDFNTFVGSMAGRANKSKANTFLGYKAGVLNVAGDFNTITGAQSGTSLVSGSQNVFNGVLSGASCDGSGNTFIGFKSGFATFSGVQNTFLGTLSGIANVSGVSNLCLGDKADVFSPGLFQASAIGSHAIVRISNTMILGDNNVNVYQKI